MKRFGTLLPGLAFFLRSTGRLGLFFDFDGTLAPIAPRPEQVWLPQFTRGWLEELAARPSLRVAIISGRELEDLRSRVAVRGAVYAGNHGLEIEADAWRWVHPGAASKRQALRHLCEQIAAQLRGLDGAQVEYKGLTATVHYRRVRAVDQPTVCRRVRSAVAAAGQEFVLRPGRCSLEIRPDVAWNKGHAVRLLAARLGIPEQLVFYFGDDDTDEDAFAALPQGITVLVGERSASCARYGLRDPCDVWRFLEWSVRQTSLQEVAEEL